MTSKMREVFDIIPHFFPCPVKMGTKGEKSHMNLYNITYLLKDPKSNRRTNTIDRRGRKKEEAVRRFRKLHPTEEILKVKWMGILVIYVGDKLDQELAEEKL